MLVPSRQAHMPISGGEDGQRDAVPGRGGQPVCQCWFGRPPRQRNIDEASENVAGIKGGHHEPRRFPKPDFRSKKADDIDPGLQALAGEAAQSAGHRRRRRAIGMRAQQ